MVDDAGEADLVELGSMVHVRLTTFRRDGTPVATPVWPVADRVALGGQDGHLLVTTGAESGKVKRLRHNPSVLLAACDARGRVAPGTQELAAVAEVLTDGAVYRRARLLLVPEHPVLARMLALTRRASAAVARVRRRPPVQEVTLRIRPADT